MNDAGRTIQRLPEVALIGALLLISGIAGLVTESLNLWELLTTWSVDPNQFKGVEQFLFKEMAPPYAVARVLGLVSIVGSVILAGASLVCGLGLRRHAPWARRTAVVVLIGLLGFPILSDVARGTATLLSGFTMSLLPGFIVETVGTVLASVLGQLSYIVMLLFLVMPGVREYFSEQRERSGRPQRLTEKVSDYLPSAIPPVISLIALLLISQAIPTLYSLGVMAWHWDANMWKAVADHFYRLFLLPLSIIYSIGALIIGVSILLRKRWSLPVAVSILLIGCVIAIPGIAFLLYTSSGMIPYSSAAILLSGSATSAVMLVYLLRYRNAVYG